MGRSERTAWGEDTWLDPAHAFSDTGRVDLFDDPRWEPAPRPPVRRTRGPDGRRAWLTLLTAALGRRPGSRGRHARRDR